MGSRGPVPKRSDERRRRNASPEGDVTSAPGASVVKAPPASREWHPMARDWYRSLAESGQAVFYEPSDWQSARIWAEVLSRQLKLSRMSAQMVAAWSSAATELLTTEGARRRARLELERVGQVDADSAASVTAMDAYRAKLGG